MNDAARGALMFIVVVLGVKLMIAGRLGAALNVLVTPPSVPSPAPAPNP